MNAPGPPEVHVRTDDRRALEAHGSGASLTEAMDALEGELEEALQEEETRTAARVTLRMLRAGVLELELECRTTPYAGLPLDPGYALQLLRLEPEREERTTRQHLEELRSILGRIVMEIDRGLEIAEEDLPFSASVRLTVALQHLDQEAHGVRADLVRAYRELGVSELREPPDREEILLRELEEGDTYTREDLEDDLEDLGPGEG